MSECKLFTILIPSFNDCRILDAIYSVKNSRNSKLARIIVIDGGSDQKLVEDIDQLLDAFDVLVSERDKGVFDALNKGLALATDKYLGWIGADDFFVKEFDFEFVSQEFESGCDGVVFGTAFINDCEVVRVSQPWFVNQLSYSMGLNIPHFSSFWRRELLSKHRFELHRAADIDFFHHLIVVEKRKIRCSQRISTAMRLGGISNSSVGAVLKSNRLVFKFFSKNYGFVRAILAVFLKLSVKIFSVAFYKVNKKSASTLHF